MDGRIERIAGELIASSDTIMIMDHSDLFAEMNEALSEADYVPILRDEPTPDDGYGVSQEEERFLDFVAAAKKIESTVRRQVNRWKFAAGGPTLVRSGRFTTGMEVDIYSQKPTDIDMAIRDLKKIADRLNRKYHTKFRVGQK